MFTSRQIKDMLDARPFKPFRIRMSDGNAYTVPHHDAAWLISGAIEVGIELDREGYALLVRRCSILHIASIEDVPGKRPSTKGRK